MSKLSIHDTGSINRSNTDRFRLHPSSLSRSLAFSSSHTSRINQSETQAQLVAFTPPLMSIRLPYSELQLHQDNYYSSPPHTENQSCQQSSPSTQYKSDMPASQPEYYVDSYTSNLSNKSFPNSSNKTKMKHVTFQEPDMTKFVFSFLSYLSSETL